MHELVGESPLRIAFPLIFTIYVKSNSRYSLVHILSTSSSKCGPKPSVFDDFDVINYLMTVWSTDEMNLSLQSRAHFVDLIVDLVLKKWSETVSRALATVSLPEKKQGFAPESVFRRELTLSRSLTPDDVVDMK